MLAIPNATFYVPTQEEIENPDELENTKVREFYRFVKDYSIFGVPVVKGKADARLKVVERWPMIQAYAIDGIGNGFFTMKNRVMDIYQSLFELYMKNEYTTKSMMMLNLSKRLMNNIQSSMDRISHTMHKNKANDLTEEILSEVMSETFEFNEMNRFEPINTVLTTPRILFGINTNGGPETRPSSKNMVETFWQKDQSALHFTIENVEALSMIRCARTYFLTSNAPKMYLIKPVFNDEGFENSCDIEIVKDSHFADEFKLTTIYLKMLQVYFNFTTSLANNISTNGRDKLKQIIEKKILETNVKMTKSENAIMKERVTVDIKFYTTLGKEFDITD